MKLSHVDNSLERVISWGLASSKLVCGNTGCNLNGRENDERTQVDTNTNKITPGLNGA